MRRPRLTGEAAVNDAVLRLLEKFEYPDELGGGVAGAGGGAGGAPTVVVAASDASDLSKSKADYICTGVNDHDTIQTAIDYMPGFGVGGRVLLTEGTFDCDYGEITTDFNRSVTIQGMGSNSTRVRFDGTSGDGFTMSFGPGQIRDMWIGDTGSGTGAAIRLHSSSGMRVDNVRFANNGTGIEIAVGSSAAREVSITRCFFTNSGIGIDATPSSGGRGSVIVGNHFTNTGSDSIRISNTGPAVIANNHINNFTGSRVSIAISGGVQSLTVTGNIINAGSDDAIAVTGSNNIDLMIADNVIEGLNGITLTSASVDGLTIANNAIDASRVGVSIDSGTVTGQVTGNTIMAPGQHGIWLNDCERIIVTDNYIRGAGSTSNNFYDGIIVSGTSPRNHIQGNTIYPSTTANTTRYGINIQTTSECNIVVGNVLGDSGDYGTDALNDNGANTQLFYPNDMTYGDNFTDCGTGS